jgi:hypothetical protein
MVIRTEYRGQRYSMGSSDPLQAGFEIRFGSLNLQATGYGNLMRITNREELRARRQTGPAPAPVAPAVRGSTPASTDAAGPRCLDTVDAPVSALGRCGRNADRLRDALTGETTSASVGECSVSGPWFPLGMRILHKWLRKRPYVSVF